jgi:hypothetical protein
MATSTFGKAFREARASGDKTFTFNGKKYTTDLAKPKTSTKSELGEEMGMPMTRDESASARRSLGSNPAEEAKMDKLNSSYGSRSSSKLSDVTRPGTNTNYENKDVSDMSMKRGGAVKKMASGGSASSRADGIAQRGKTKGRVC